MASTQRKNPNPNTPTLLQQRTRRMMKAYLEAPLPTRHLAAKEARREPKK